MKLGFDLDGTVADLQGALAREARGLFPGVDASALPRSVAPHAEQAAAAGDPPPADAPVFSMSGLSQRQQRQLWDAACARTR